ncbi:hypothetical protein OAP65_04590 [Litorivicinus sp.]|nr:hypothetical protein [Litorivicinus sp.]
MQISTLEDEHELFRCLAIDGIVKTRSSKLFDLDNLKKLCGHIEDGSNTDFLKVKHPNLVEADQFSCKDTEANFSLLEHTFDLSFVERLGDEFFGQEQLGCHVHVTNFVGNNGTVLPWHFDRLQTIKLWIYLEPVDDDRSGALKVMLGTHFETRALVQASVNGGVSLEHVSNDLNESRAAKLDGVSVFGGIEDLYIFDPGIYHTGSVLEAGRRRKVFRLDIFPLRRRDFDHPLDLVALMMRRFRRLMNVQTVLIGDQHSFSNRPRTPK